MNKVFIIAEAGVNHNGSFDRAISMIKIAKQAGADAVKFQTAVPELVMIKNAEKAAYQLQTTSKNESQLEMAKKIHLPLHSFKDLRKECDNKKIEFMSTAFDDMSIKILKEVGLKRWKIPSGEITNLPYLRQVGAMKRPVIMSTGMATLKETKNAADILFDAGLKRNFLTILHCNTEYPTPANDVNLKAMLTLRKELKVEVGYSDHTLGFEVSIAAAAMGAAIIEKHFTLDRSLPGPDHAASLEPDELKSMINAIRNIEKAIGDGIKRPSDSEKKNITIARKSIVAKTFIDKGDIFTEKNIAVKRPGTGVSPMKWDALIGKNAHKKYKKDDLIDY